MEIPTFIVQIGPHAFYNCTKLKSVTFLPESKLKSIGESSFAHCSIENSELLLFEPFVFYETQIESLFVPPKVIEFKEEWCSKTTKLNRILVAKNNQLFEFVDDKFLVGKSDQKSDFFDVLLFARRDIKEAAIPSFISRICCKSFADYMELNSITFCEDSKLKKIDRKAFSFCPIESIFISSSADTKF